jgi:hypothetical protein
VPVLFGLRYWYVARNYLQLAGQLLIAGAVYGLALLWAHRAGHLWKSRGLVGAEIMKAASTPVEYVDP